jgi:cyclohexadienyl dehydratase
LQIVSIVPRSLRAKRRLLFLLALVAIRYPQANASPILTDTGIAQQSDVERPSAPNSRLDEILARGTLRVGLSGDYRPFSIVVGPTMEGLEVDMATSLAKSLGVKLELVRFTWPTLMQDLATNKFDIAMGGISINLQRQRVAYFSVPVMHGGKTPITRCTDKEKYQTLSDIDQPSVRVIEPPGGTNEIFAKTHLHQAHIEIFPDNATIFDQIISGKADVMITDSVETLTQQKLHKELCAIHPDHPFNNTDLAYLLPRDVTWKAYVDQWLNIMNQTGERKQLLAKWLE